MKVLILFVITMTSFNLIAKDQSSKQAYTFTGSDGRWVMGKMNSYPTKDGEVYVQNFARYFYEVDHPFELGNISYISIPISKNTKNKSTSKEIKEMLEQMFDLKDLKLSNYNKKSNQWVIQGEYEKLGRFFRSIITQHSTRYSISTAFIRKPYRSSIDFSAIGIQNDLIKREEKLITENIPHKSSILNFIFPSAYAQMTPGAGAWVPDGPAMPYPSGAPNSPPTTPCPLQVPGANPTIICPPVSSCNPRARDYLTCIANVSECRQKAILNEATDRGGMIMAKASQQSCLWNLSFNKATAIIQNALTPNNIFALSAAGAAGITVGSWAANLAIGGLESGAKFLFDTIWDWASGKNAELEHQKLVELFLKNKSDWEKANKEAMEIASFIDSSIELLEIIKGSGKNLEEILSEKIRKQDELNLDLKVKEKEYMDLSLDKFACSEDKVQKRAEVLSLTDNLRQITKEVNKLKELSPQAGSMQSMCRNLNSNLDKLLKLEDGLQKARMNILRSYDEFQKQTVREIDKQRERDREIAEADPGEQLEELQEEYLESFEDAVDEADIDSEVITIAKKACFDIEKQSIPYCQSADYSKYQDGEDTSTYSMQSTDCLEVAERCHWDIFRQTDYMRRISLGVQSGKLNPKQIEKVKAAYQKIEPFRKTYQTQMQNALRQFESKSKTQGALVTGEEVQNINDKTISDWVIALRTEQACQKSPQLFCASNDSQCHELKKDCDKIRHNDICFNLPLEQSCQDSTCKQLKSKCDSYKLQTGCPEIISRHHSERCTNEECKKQLEQCKSQADGNVLFRFENIKLQKDYLKNGVCDGYI